MKTKKVISLLLAVVMLLSMIPTAIFSSAADETISDDVQYQLYVDEGAKDGQIKLSFNLRSNGEAAITIPKFAFFIDLNTFDVIRKNGAVITDSYKNDLGMLSDGTHKPYLAAETLYDEDEEEYEYVLTGGSFTSYVESTGKLWINIVGTLAGGFVFPEEFTEFGNLTIALKSGKTLADAKAGIGVLTSANDSAKPSSDFKTSITTTNVVGKPVNNDTDLKFSDAFAPSTTEYTITFKYTTADGDKSKDVTVAEGEIPAVPDEVKANYSTGDYDYSFDGFEEGNPVAATANATYNAKYAKQETRTALETKYNAVKDTAKGDYTDASWADFVAARDAAKSLLDAADIPTKSAVQQALTALTEAYDNLRTPAAPVTYVYKFRDEANLWTTEDIDVAEGVDPVTMAPAAPETIRTVSTTYTLTGWNKTGEIEYTAQYSEDPTTYTLIYNYKDASDTNKSTMVDNVPYGANPADYIPADFAANYEAGDYDVEQSFTFSPVEGSAVYTATENRQFVPADYSAVDAAITAANAKRNAYGEENAVAAYGDDAVTALDNAIAAVVRDKGRTAQDDVAAMAAAIDQAADALTLKEYPVKFVNGVTGDTIQSGNYAYGHVFTEYPAAPEEFDSADGLTHYRFDSWSDTLAPVTGEKTYTANYAASANPADYTAYDAAVADATTKLNNGTRWTPASASALTDAINAGVNRNLTKADQATVDLATQNIINLTNALVPQGQISITFTGIKNADGTPANDVVLNVYPGDSIANDIPEPVNAEDDNYNYTFLGWAPATPETNPTESKTYTADYLAVEKSADYSALDDAIAAATAKQAEQEYAAKYTDATKSNVATALEAAEGISRDLKKSQQSIIDTAAANLNNAVAALAKNTFAVTFTGLKDADGNALTDVTKEVAYGDTTTAAATAASYKIGDTTYTFTGFNPAFDATAPVKANATYTAHYSDSFDGANYTILDATIAEAQQRKTQEPNFDHYYTEASLAEFNAAVAAGQAIDRNLGASQQATVDAATNRIANALTNLTPIEFTVNWFINAGDAEPYATGTYHYGDTLNAPVDPSKPATAQYTYEFTGWTPTPVTTVTASAEYIANFNAVVNKYTVTLNYKDGNGDDKNATYTDIPYGTSIIAAMTADGLPADFAEGYQTVDKVYTFLDFGIDATATVTGNTIVNARYNNVPRTYTIEFNYRDETGAEKQVTGNVAYGDTPAIPADFAASYSIGDTTYYAQWNTPIVPVTGNATYTANYSSEFHAADYTALDEAIAQATAKQAEDNYADKYTDASKAALSDKLAAAQGVDRNLGVSQQSVINDATQELINALNGLTRNSYTVTFKYKNANNENVEESAIYSYGDTPVVPALNDIIIDADTTNVCDGWDNTPVAVTANATYTANYREVFNAADYTALDPAIARGTNAQNEDNYADKYTEASRNALADAIAAAQAVPAGLGASQQARIDDAVAAIDDAIAGLTKVTFTISFTTMEGTSSQTVAYGDTPIAPEGKDIPDGDILHKFVDWNAPIVPATANADYMAIYNDVANPADYTALDAALADAAAKAADPEFADKYTGDSRQALDDAIATGRGVARDLLASQQPVVNAATQAIVDALNGLTKNTFTVNWYDNSGLVVTTIVEYGDTPVAPTDFVKQYDVDNMRYTFAGWDPEIAPATADADYTALYEGVEIPDEPDFTPDMSYIEKLIKIYNTMVGTGKYNKADLAKVQKFIDVIYSTEYTDQNTIDQDGAKLKVLIDNCRLIKTSSSKTVTKTTSARTGDDMALIVMSVILVSSLGIAVISIRRRKREEIM